MIIYSIEMHKREKKCYAILMTYDECLIENE